ncbi:MAG: response regulator [Desulfobacteraceae bacterium]|nr:MAG: response regulator [Desulfobacteraceae bacterium]
MLLSGSPSPDPDKVTSSLRTLRLRGEIRALSENGMKKDEKSTKELSEEELFGKILNKSVEFESFEGIDFKSISVEGIDEESMSILQMSRTSRENGLARKVLIIDDEENHCRLLKKALERKGGFEVISATTGKEGIELARSKKPEIIVMDLVMPGMDGTEVAETLEGDSETSTIPIIFVTGMLTRDEANEQNAASSRGYFMAKPILIDELVHKMKSILSSQGDVTHHPQL